MATIVLILMLAILLFVLWKLLKPYFIKYDTSVLVTGELGSGKTLTLVKIAITEIRKARQRVWWKNKIIKWYNKRANKYNAKIIKKKLNKQPKELKNQLRRPQLFSNIPIHFKTKMFRKTKEWSVKLLIDNMALYQNIPDYSVVMIDELPQFVNQFNWDNELAQKNINEWITFFRHYWAGKLLMSAQATNDIVVQIRRKCNQAIWCNNFKKHLFGLFYTQNMCDMVLDDNISTMSTTFIEDNTRKHYGFFPPKGTYDTRCFSDRTKNALQQIPEHYTRWNQLKTNEIMRLEEWQSPLDDTTSKETKEKGLNALKQRRIKK